jgi:hypothetical protein
MDRNNIKFNIGLTLSTNLKEFQCFLNDYRQHIESVYFSLPLGVNHQTRQKIHLLFSKKKKVALFWEMLRMIKAYGIELELLLNAYSLSSEDVKQAAELLKEHDIEIDAVCPLEHLYKDAVHFFPGKKMICSYNNGLRSIADFDEVAKKYDYDYYVIASASIRNNELFRHIHESGKKVILLVNNACSFNCGWCRKKGSCMKTFRQNLKTHSVEYLYALQTILPNELHDGTIDLSAIDLLKFSNRTSSLKYTKNGLDSYLSGTMIRYIRNSRMNYSLYARMQGFWKYFLFLRHEKIREYKEKILGHPVIFK